MDLNAQVTEELVLSFYVPGEATTPARLELTYYAEPGDLAALIAELGGIEAFSARPTSPLLRRDVPVTCDGEQVATLAINVFLKGDEQLPRFPAVERLLEQKEAIVDA